MKTERQQQAQTKKERSALKTTHANKNRVGRKTIFKRISSRAQHNIVTWCRLLDKLTKGVIDFHSAFYSFEFLFVALCFRSVFYYSGFFRHSNKKLKRKTRQSENIERLKQQKNERITQIKTNKDSREANKNSSIEYKAEWKQNIEFDVDFST